MRGVFVGLLVSLALAGCAESQTTQAESAHGTVDALIRTCAEGRPHDSLEMLTAAAKDALVSASSATQGCLELLGLPVGRGGRASRLRELSASRVVSTRANDLTATVSVSSPAGGRSRIRLENSRGQWLVTHGVSAR